jgi:hypothetical protein
MLPLNNGGYTVYRYTNGCRYKQCVSHPTLGMMCGDKLNIDIMDHHKLDAICKYRINYQSLAPEDLYWFLKYGPGGETYDSNFDKNSPDHYLNHHSSVKEMFRSHGYDVDSPHLQRLPLIEEGIPPTPNQSTAQST